MFGLITANPKEFTPEERERYLSLYCGICRNIRSQNRQFCGLALQYDMVFLALVLSSLYEPQEDRGDRACWLHPIEKRKWTESEITRYAADMNVALAYYNAQDNWKDEKSLSALIQREIFAPHVARIAREYPRQCQTIAQCLERLSELEEENCSNPDLPANCFGELMAELFCFREDFWSLTLRQIGFHLGRFVYLADAALDLQKDRRSGNYNPLLRMEPDSGPERWDESLMMAMAMCTQSYERLPLVQDKALMDRILYHGVWWAYYAKGKRKREDEG